jgi:Zn-finger nucleic acid-binding protein
MLACPNDNTTLTTISVEEVSVEECATCGGFWLQRGELEQLGEHHGAHLEPITIGAISVVDSARKCPQDSTALRRHEFAEHSGITIDQCPTCLGIWLDKGELASILSNLDKERTKEPEVNTEPTLSQRVMLFLYQLVKNPPYH